MHRHQNIGSSAYELGVQKDNNVKTQKKPADWMNLLKKSLSECSVARGAYMKESEHHPVEAYARSFCPCYAYFAFEY